MKIEISLSNAQSLSAVPLSLARRYMKHFNRGRYANIFNKYGEGKGKDKYRIYIPVNATHMVAPKTMSVPKEIEDYLTSLGMKIDNYAVGTVHLPDGKRIVRLGKVLAKNAELKKMYDNDPQRKATKLVSSWVVISCHPYDIIGMSFDRGWTSCMNISDNEDEAGSNQEFVLEDVKEGTLVAYLIKETDRNINAPTARIAIKPYRQKSHSVLAPGGVYGSAPPSFADIVQKFCDYANSGSPVGKYVLPEELYDDGTGQEYDHYTEESMRSSDNPFRKMNVNQTVHAARRLESTIALNFLSGHESAEVRAAVARNPKCTEEILTALSTDQNPEVLYYVAIHKHTPASILLDLAKNENERVKRGAIRNANFIPVAWNFIESNTSKEVALIFAESTAMSETEVDKFLSRCRPEWNDDLFHSFAKSDKLPSATKGHLILSYPEHEELWAHCAGMTVFDTEVYTRLAESNSETVLEHLAANRALPDPIQIKLITHPYAVVRMGMARNNLVHAVALTALVNHIDYSVKSQVGILLFAIQRAAWGDDHLRVVLKHPESYYFIISHALPDFALEYIENNTKSEEERNEVRVIRADNGKGKK